MSIEENILLAPYTYYKIGGPARYFLQGDDPLEIAKALREAHAEGLPHFILGGGSNILISDKGFNGLVIHPTLKKITREGDVLHVDSGARWQDVVDTATREGLQGVEWGQGIPGDMGGAIRGNIGAYYPTVGGTLSDVVANVRAINHATGEMYDLAPADVGFDYRHSSFKTHRAGDLVIGASLKLKPADSTELKRKNIQIQTYRDERHPKEPSAGSTFKNIKDKSFIIPFVEANPDIRELYTKRWNGKIPAAFLIDAIGMRGFRIGGIQVSPKHANFLVNVGGGTAEHVIMMTSTIKQRIRNKYVIRLQEEIAYVGFD